ncbi:MAG: DNA photolyase [Deltaproteobacteria bacterium]|nr:MAG: DNA photolyase [Deltaproteobacteria bacterium]
MRFLIKNVGIEPAAQEYSFVSKALGNVKRFLPQAKIWFTQCPEPSEESRFSKDLLCFFSYQGEFLKPCPGTTEHICCGYQILNVGTGCPMDCSYCILQSYFSEGGLKVFANIEKGLDIVLRRIDSEPNRIFRVGTGEFTDSLALDPVTGWAELLIPCFSCRKNAVLELKTKTDNIEGVLHSDCRDRIVISWSLNSPWIASKEEHGAASVRKRLEAARLCQSEGFAIGFHFDPLISYPGWKEGYLETLELMDRLLRPERIIWISLGSFRFMPPLKRIIRKRHPHSIVANGEFIPGKDGKMRYFKPIRVELYHFMMEHLHQWSDDLGLYLCMESPDVWEESMGWNPGDTEGLSAYLDRRVHKIFG